VQTHACAHPCLTSDNSPYFAQHFSYCNSFVARRTRLPPEDDSIITILNTANHLRDNMGSKFKRLQCELYRRASFTYEHDEKHQFDFWIWTCDPRFHFVQQTDWSYIYWKNWKKYILGIWCCV